MTKHKRMLNADESVVEVIPPVTEDEILDRRKHYAVLAPKKFAKRYQDMLFRPVTFSYQNVLHSIQYNFCGNPFCESFGQPQERYENQKYKPSRYKLFGKGGNENSFDNVKKIACNPVNESIHFSKTTHNCRSAIYSNWSIAEEIKRLINLQTLTKPTIHYHFHKEGCLHSDTTPQKEKHLFYKRGKSKSNSPRYQCKTCGKITNIQPNKKASTTYHQKRNDILPQLFLQIINRVPVKRSCELLNIGSETYYRKMEWVYRCCLEFLTKREKEFENKTLDSVWLNIDKMQYHLNNIRQKNKAVIPQVEIEESKFLQTFINVVAEVESRYVFRADIAYDSSASFEGLKADTMKYNDDHVDFFCRKNERLKYSSYPMKPTPNDFQTNSDYLTELTEVNKRATYVEGLHVTSSYTTMAQLWLIQQMVKANKWRFVTDEDGSLINPIYRVFSHEFLQENAHLFIYQYDKDKSLKQAYKQYSEVREIVSDWATMNKISGSYHHKAYMYLKELLEHTELVDMIEIENKLVPKYKRTEILQPIAFKDKGYAWVICRTDVSHLDKGHLTNLILKVNDHATNSFIQLIRRKISILERPLLTAKADKKSYIYANYNPKYAQYALTILRTYYNFCMPVKSYNGDDRTPAERIGIADRAYTIYDILYK